MPSNIEKEILWAPKCVLPDKEVEGSWQTLRARRRLNLPRDLALNVCVFLPLKECVSYCTLNRDYYYSIYPLVWYRLKEYRNAFPTSKLPQNEWKICRLNLGLHFFWQGISVDHVYFQDLRDDEEDLRYLLRRLKCCRHNSTEYKTNQRQLQVTRKLITGTLKECSPKLLKLLRVHAWNSTCDQFLTLKVGFDYRVFGCPSYEVWEKMEGNILAQDPGSWLRIRHNDNDLTVEEDEQILSHYRHRYFDNVYDPVSRGAWLYKKRMLPEWWPQKVE